MDIVVLTFIALIALLACLAVWRFLNHRHSGTQVLMRRVPAQDARGWRHGVIQYHGEKLDFYKLRSISPNPDISFDRCGFLLKDRRNQTAFEQKFMESSRRIIALKTNQGEFEWALDPHAEMALLAWIESAPTQPLQRMDVKTAQKYLRKEK
ncbi:DUF2550 domain-containing protein [Corynebacterium sp. H127]|uniref:DUF2550 domain-containing protein n=1 Tax=Corynebacterium sp. H127 TaxID=3133418 RepID=UPI00309FC854